MIMEYQTYNLWGDGDKVKKSSNWKHMIRNEIDDVARKKLSLNLLNTEDQWVSSAIVMIILYNQH